MVITLSKFKRERDQLMNVKMDGNEIIFSKILYFYFVIRNNLKMACMFHQRKPNERPLPLPKQATLIGPYADDAKRLINVEVLLSKPADPFLILEIGRIW